MSVRTQIIRLRPGDLTPPGPLHEESTIHATWCICYGRKSNNLTLWRSHTNAADMTSDRLMQAIWRDIDFGEELVSQQYFGVLLTPYWAGSFCSARLRRSSCKVRCKPSSRSQVTSCRRPTGPYFSLKSTNCSHFEIILLLRKSLYPEGRKEGGCGGRAEILTQISSLDLTTQPPTGANESTHLEVTEGADGSAKLSYG